MVPQNRRDLGGGTVFITQEEDDNSMGVMPTIDIYRLTIWEYESVQEARGCLELENYQKWVDELREARLTEAPASGFILFLRRFERNLASTERNSNSEPNNAGVSREVM